MSVSRYRLARHIVGRQLEGAYFVLNLETNKLFELNGTGCVIWKLVEQGLDRSEIERRLRVEFDVDPDQLTRDVQELLSELVQAGVLIEDAVVLPAEPLQERRPSAGWLVRWTPADTEPQVFGLELCTAAFGFAALGGYLFDAEAGAAHRVAAAYQQSGAEFVDDLRGGYVAIVWDRNHRTLQVARDATGLRPCFYTWDGRALHVSSSIDTLLALPGTSREINRVVMAEFLHGQFPEEQKSETFYQAISRIPAASRLTLQDGAVRIAPYWDPVPPGFAWAGEQEAEEIIPRLDQAVRRCMSAGADSVALSGGFDSVSIAILAARHRREPAHALSMRYRGSRADEGETQSAVAHALGMPLHQMDAGHVLELEDFAERALAITAGAPSPRVGMMQWSFSSLIAEGRALGCRSIMLGNGGDELFNVDPSYAQDLLRAGDLRALYQLTRARQRTSPLSGPAAARHVLWSCGLRPILRSSARRAIPKPALDLARRWLGRDRWFLAPDPELGQAMTRRAAPEPEPGKVYESSMRGAVNTASLLHDVDQTSAWAERHKVSLLYPYYDRDLVSLALRCPPAMLYRTGQMKSPLRGLVDRELSQVWLPGRKVDFTGEANRCLRPSLRHLWRRLGGAKRLEELNIVSPDRIEQWIDGYIHGRAGGLRHVWSIFAAEVWLRGAR